MMRLNAEGLLRLLFLAIWLGPSVSFGGAPWVGSDFSGQPCSGPGNRGRDYTDSRPGPHGREFLPVVENKHFKPDIQNMVMWRRGNGSLGGVQGIANELHYILGQFPNHYRVLHLLALFPEKIVRRISEAEQGEWLGLDENPVYSVVIELSQRDNKPRFECYFARAIGWHPKDPVLHVLYGIYAHKTGRYERAQQSYEEAIKLNSRYADAYYNLGLLLFERKQFEEARKAARSAYNLGYQLPALRRKLAEADYPIN